MFLCIACPLLLLSSRPLAGRTTQYTCPLLRSYIHRTAEKLQQESKQHNRDKESEHNEDEIQRASQPAAAAGDAAAQESASPSSVAAAAVPAGGGENGSAVSLGLNAAETSLGSCQGSGGGSVADR